MYCSKCGTKNSEEAQFCKECGHKLSDIAPIHKRKSFLSPKKIGITLGILCLFVIGGVLIKTFLFEKGAPTEKNPPKGVIFKTFSTEEGFTVEYPDWSVSRETEEEVAVVKENEVVISIITSDEGSGLGNLIPEEIKKMENEFREQVSKEEGVNLINLKVTQDSILTELTLTGEQVIKGKGAEYITIDIDKSKLYHFYTFIKVNDEGKGVMIVILCLGDKWPKYKNITKHMIDSIKVLPPQQTKTEDSEIEDSIRAQDNRRIADMRQFATAQEMYYYDNKKYKTAGIQDGLPVVKDYLAGLDDPQSALGKHYQWLDNTMCPQNYCAYVILGDRGSCRDVRFFVASEKGTKEVCKSEIDFTTKIDGCSCW